MLKQTEETTETQEYLVLPHNIEAEQLLIGCILLDNKVLEDLFWLRADHFFDPLHHNLFALIQSAVHAGTLASPVTLRDSVKDWPVISALPFDRYVGRLATNALGAQEAVHYARLVKNLAVRRDLFRVGRDITDDALCASFETDPNEQIVDAEQALCSLAENGTQGQTELSFGTILEQAVTTINEAFRSQAKLVGISTGFNDLDAKLGGMRNGNLIIIAGRPAMGKSALAANIAFNVAKRNIPIVFFSQEMTGEELATRLLAERVGIAATRLVRGDVDKHDVEKAIRESHHIARYPFWTEQTGGLSLAHLAAKARRYKRRHGVGLIVIDYLQLMHGSKRDGNRVADVTEITMGLKALAKELSVPIVALSQLSRKVEERADKRPQLADLRDSGSIEQDADVVLFVYREEYYVEREQPDPSNEPKHLEWQQRMMRCAGKAEIIQAKHRHAPTGTVQMAFEGSLTRFSDLAGGHA